MLTKSIWEAHVLPEMASRLGLSVNGYDPYVGLSWVNKSLIAQTGTYPPQPVISVEEYSLLHKYLIANAPEELILGKRPEGKGLLQGFSEESIVLDSKEGAMVSMVQYDGTDHAFMIGTVGGGLISINELSADTLATTYSPVVSWARLEGEELIAEIGVLPPSEMREGSLGIRKGENFLPIARSLHRPVDVHVADLNGDGLEEIVVCEYGHYAGTLSLWQQNAVEKYESEALLSIPGALRVLAEDMNGDEKPDLIVVYGQGNEGVFILYQEDSLEFRPEQVIRAEALYGTSWMELVDYDHDGDLDIILAQGDNADYSYSLKPYHGIRIYLNDGTSHFEEAFFYPMYGATRVLARDFDEDGDVDLAVCAYFPDFEGGKEDAFVYLDHEDGTEFGFAGYQIESASLGRWITADAGDYDGDGDMDILLGSFTHTPTPVPMNIQQIWNTPEAPDLLLLRNELK